MSISADSPYGIVSRALRNTYIRVVKREWNIVNSVVGFFIFHTVSHLFRNSVSQLASQPVSHTHTVSEVVNQSVSQTLSALTSVQCQQSRNMKFCSFVVKTIFISFHRLSYQAIIQGIVYASLRYHFILDVKHEWKKVNSHGWRWNVFTLFSLLKSQTVGLLLFPSYSQHWQVVNVASHET